MIKSLFSARRLLRAFLALTFCLCATGSLRAVAEDELVLLSGTRIKGTVLSDVSQEIRFLSQDAEFFYPYSKIQSLTVKGERRVLNAAPAKPAPAKPVAAEPKPAPPSEPKSETLPKPALMPSATAKGGAKPGARSKAEVDAEIQKVGAVPPDWFNATPLNFPKTLDLSMAPPANKVWDPNKNVGQYFWSIINENPSKWKEGVRFAAHLMQVNQGDPSKVNQALGQMGHLYEDCLVDYQRAAYCLIKKGDVNDERLAVCYFQLGCPDAAKDILRKYGNDDTRFGNIIKMWADMGEYDIALKLAEEKARNGMQEIGYLMAGDTCRQAGKYKEAIDYYQKALTAAAGKGRTPARAQNSIDAIKVYELLDLNKVVDGTYKNSAQGYSSVVTVELTVAAHKITDVKVTDHHEKQYYNSISEVPKRILEKQSVKGVDTFSSATITSEAIINASGKALSSGMK